MTPLSDDDLLAVKSMMDHLDKVLAQKKQYVAVADKTFDAAKDAAIRHHCRFLKRCAMRPTTVDAYKILSWYGFYLAENADDDEKISVLAAMYVMNHMLDEEKTGRRLAKELILHLYQLVKNDGIDDDFGIGKNGVYSVFTTASNILRELDQNGMFKIFQVPVVDGSINQ